MIRRTGGYTTDPFVDLLFNALLGFTLLFFVSLVYFNPEARQGKVNLKAEYIISVTWPENRTDDIDLWVRDPLGEIVSYLKKDAGWLTLIAMTRARSTIRSSSKAAKSCIQSIRNSSHCGA